MSLALPSLALLAPEYSVEAAPRNNLGMALVEGDTRLRMELAATESHSKRMLVESENFPPKVGDPVMQVGD